MRLENSNKGTLKSSQRPLMWPSSPPLLHLVVSSPYCVPYFAAAGVQTCQALPLHTFSSVPPKSNDSFCAQSCWRCLQEAVEWVGSAHTTCCRFDQRLNALLFAARAWSFAGSTKLKMGSPVSVTFCNLFQMRPICSRNCRLYACTLP